MADTLESIENFKPEISDKNEKRLKNLLKNESNNTKEELFEKTDIFDELPVVFIGKYSFDNTQLVENFGDDTTESDVLVSLLKRVFQKKYPITQNNDLPKVPSRKKDKDLLIELLNNYFNKLRVEVIKQKKTNGNSMNLRQKITQLQEIKVLLDHFETSKSKFPYHLFQNFIDNEDYLNFKEDLEEQLLKEKEKGNEDEKIRGLLRQFAKMYLLQSDKNTITLTGTGESKEKFEEFRNKIKEKIPQTLVKLLDLLEDKLASEKEPDYDLLYDILIKKSEEFEKIQKDDVSSPNTAATSTTGFATSGGDRYFISKSVDIDESLKSFIDYLLEEYKKLKEEKSKLMVEKENEISQATEKYNELKKNFDTEVKENLEKENQNKEKYTELLKLLEKVKENIDLITKQKEQALQYGENMKETYFSFSSRILTFINKVNNLLETLKNYKEQNKQDIFQDSDFNLTVDFLKNDVDLLKNELQGESQAPNPESTPNPETTPESTPETINPESTPESTPETTPETYRNANTEEIEKFANNITNNIGEDLYYLNINKKNLLKKKINVEDAIDDLPRHIFDKHLSKSESLKKLTTDSEIFDFVDKLVDKIFENKINLNPTLPSTIKENLFNLIKNKKQSVNQSGGNDSLYKYSIKIANDRLDDFLLEEPLPFFEIINSFDKSIIRETNELYLLKLFVENQFQTHFHSHEMKDFFTQFNLLFDKSDFKKIAHTCFVLYEICNLIQRNNSIDVVKLESNDYSNEVLELEQTLKTSVFDFYDIASKQLLDLDKIDIKLFESTIYFKTKTNSFEKTYTIDSKLKIKENSYEFNEELYVLNNKVIYFFFILSVYNTIKSNMKNSEIVETLLKHTRTTKRNLKKSSKNLIKEKLDG